MNNEQIQVPLDQSEHISECQSIIVFKRISMDKWWEFFTRFSIKAIKFPTNFGAGWEGPFPGEIRNFRQIDDFFFKH